MPRDTLAIYIHLVWATWDRLPLITPAIERPLHRVIALEAQKMGCTVLALNSVPDHLHILVQMPSTVTAAELVKRLKGVSSHFVNDVLRPGLPFKWQGFYGALSVSRWDVERIVAYIQRQKEHHQAGSLITELESVSWCGVLWRIACFECRMNSASRGLWQTVGLRRPEKASLRWRRPTPGAQRLGRPISIGVKACADREGVLCVGGGRCLARGAPNEFGLGSLRPTVGLRRPERRLLRRRSPTLGA
jgi:REP element-mobilizing transposase RayT